MLGFCLQVLDALNGHHLPSDAFSIFLQLFSLPQAQQVDPEAGKNEQEC